MMIMDGIHTLITLRNVINNITTYLSDYSRTEWPNLKYWYAHDEPHSIDAFAPIKTVDEIVRNAGSVPLITHFFEVNVYKNGEYIYEHFYNAVQPEKLMFDAYPFHTNPPEGHGFDYLTVKNAAISRVAARILLCTTVIWKIKQFRSGMGMVQAEFSRIKGFYNACTCSRFKRYYVFRLL